MHATQSVSEVSDAWIAHPGNQNLMDVLHGRTLHARVQEIAAHQSADIKEVI